MRAIAIILILSSGTCAIAQENLISNGSFEELQFPQSQYPCPTSAAAISQTTHWNSAWGSVDYFNACSNEDWPLWGVPGNWFGNQLAYEGAAYAALVGYSAVFSNAREFLWQELDQSLKPGFGYMFTMQVSLNDSDEWACNGLGALFTESDTRLWSDGDLFFSAQPQVIHLGVPITNKSEWMEISGYFIAGGGEKYISIGNFLGDDDSALSIQRVDTFADIPVTWEKAAYYIDAITLYEVSGVGLPDIHNPDITVFPNPSDQEVRITHAGKQGELTLREITGRIVSKGRTSMESTIVGTSDLAEGIYVLEFVSDTGTKWQFRVVVQHR